MNTAGAHCSISFQISLCSGLVSDMNTTTTQDWDSSLKDAVPKTFLIFIHAECTGLGMVKKTHSTHN